MCVCPAGMVCPSPRRPRRASGAAAALGWAWCLAALACGAAASTPTPPDSATVVEAMDGVSVTVDADGATPVGTGLKVLLKLYDDCSRRDGLMQCVKVKAATLLDRVARAGDLPITETLTLVRRPDSARTHVGRALSEAELEAALPSGDSYAAKDAKLNELLWERVARGAQLAHLPAQLPQDVRVGDEGHQWRYR